MPDGTAELKTEITLIGTWNIICDHIGLSKPLWSWCFTSKYVVTCGRYSKQDRRVAEKLIKHVINQLNQLMKGSRVDVSSDHKFPSKQCPLSQGNPKIQICHRVDFSAIRQETNMLTPGTQCLPIEVQD